MDVKTAEALWLGMDDEIERLAAHGGDKDLRARAEKALAQWPPETIREAALLYVVGEAHASWRVHNLKVELAAEQAARQQAEDARKAELWQGKYRHGSISEKDGAAFRGCPCDLCTATREREKQWEQERWDEAVALTDKLRQLLRIEWTDELLAAGFALPDGMVVTWAVATIGQHQERIAMLRRNVQANAQAAARHLKAIEVIEDGGGQCLADVVGRSVTPES